MHVYACKRVQEGFDKKKGRENGNIKNIGDKVIKGRNKGRNNKRDEINRGNSQ